MTRQMQKTAEEMQPVMEQAAKDMQPVMTQGIRGIVSNGDPRHGTDASGGACITAI